MRTTSATSSSGGNLTPKEQKVQTERKTARFASSIKEDGSNRENNTKMYKPNRKDWRIHKIKFDGMHKEIHRVQSTTIGSQHRIDIQLLLQPNTTFKESSVYL